MLLSARDYYIAFFFPPLQMKACVESETGLQQNKAKQLDKTVTKICIAPQTGESTAVGETQTTNERCASFERETKRRKKNQTGEIPLVECSLEALRAQKSCGSWLISEDADR